MNVPHSPCEESSSYSFTRCVHESLSARAGCRQEWDLWTDHGMPVCTKIGQLKIHYDEFLKIHQLEKKELATKTGCPLPCMYKEYKQVSNPLQKNPDLRVLNLVRSTNTVHVKKEHPLYPFSSFLAEFGGALGLFLGFSFLTVWDWFQIIFAFTISKIELMKPPRRQRL